MVAFELLYSQFLSSISSYTLAQLSDDEIQAELFNFAKRAITNFKFPKIDLSYTFDETTYTYSFDNAVTQKELNVILSYMKVAWIDFIISKEERFQGQYFDDNVRTFSMGNILAQLNRLYENLVAKAEREEYNYGRVNALGKPRIGDLNG
jgi:hypothetical protein